MPWHEGVDPESDLVVVIFAATTFPTSSAACMAELASEWGFVGFGGDADYPALNDDAPGEHGKRARKSDKRRRQQLEELVEGIVRLPRPVAGT